MNDCKYIDIHGHLNFSAYDADRDEAIKRMNDNKVAAITVGVDFESSKSALELANAHEGIYATVGLHPVHTGPSHHDHEQTSGHSELFEKGETIDYQKYLALSKNKKVIAIGEC